MLDDKIQDSLRMNFFKQNLHTYIQSNLFNTDTKRTEPSVRFTEVSVL